MRVSYLASLVAIVVPLAACGGKLNAETESADTGSASDGSASDTTPTPTETGVSEVAVDVAPDAPIPTPKTCERLANSICGKSLGACCTKHGFGWDEDECRGDTTTWCNYQVDQVALGRATYDGSQLEACAKSWETMLAKCEVGWIEWTKSQLPCSQLFNGKKEPGQTCSTQIECNAPSGFAAYCDTKVKPARCRAYGFVGEGKPCNYTGSTIRYCDEGLYCDYASGAPTCKKAKPIGADCFGPDDPSCGYSHVCKEGKCAVGLPGGAACTGNGECSSWSCKDGKCEPTSFPLASETMCPGTGGSPDAGPSDGGSADAGSAEASPGG